MSSTFFLFGDLMDAITLIKDLEALRQRLNKSGVERTQGLQENMGDNCSYYKKSLSLFVDRDYIDLKNLITRLKEQFDNIK